MISRWKRRRMETMRMKRESRPTASTPLLTLWNWEGVETVWWFVKCHPEPEQSQSSRRRKFPPGKNFTNHIHSKLISFQLLRPYHQIIIFSNDEHRIIAKSEMRTQRIQYFLKATVQLYHNLKTFLKNKYTSFFASWWDVLLRLTHSWNLNLQVLESKGQLWIFGIVNMCQ